MAQGKPTVWAIDEQVTIDVFHVDVADRVVNEFKPDFRDEFRHDFKEKFKDEFAFIED